MRDSKQTKLSLLEKELKASLLSKSGDMAELKNLNQAILTKVQGAI